MSVNLFKYCEGKLFDIHFLEGDRISSKCLDKERSQGISSLGINLVCIACSIIAHICYVCDLSKNNAAFTKRVWHLAEMKIISQKF